MTNKTILWVADDGNNRFIDLLNGTVSQSKNVDENLLNLRADGAWTINQIAGNEIDIPEHHALHIRVSPDGILLFLAVATPSLEIRDLFSSHPGLNLSERGKRAWIRTLGKTTHMFAAINGATDIVEFVQCVRFPVEIVIVEE